MFKEIMPKALNSAIMQKWPLAICHFMEDTVKVDGTCEDLLKSLSGFCNDAHMNMPIIHALTILLPTQSNAAKKRLALEMYTPPLKPPKSTHHADDQDEAKLDEAKKKRIKE